jgi:hypothetical protein
MAEMEISATLRREYPEKNTLSRGC